MSSLIEKPDGTNILTVRITLKPERDKIMISFIHSVPPRGMASLIREMMRNGCPKLVEPSDQDESEDQDNLMPDLGIDL